MPNLMGIMGLLPVAFILTASFFILFAASKTELKWLKNYGYFVSAFLCCCAVIIIVTGIYILINVRPMMQRGMNMHNPNSPMQHMSPDGPKAK